MKANTMKKTIIAMLALLCGLSVHASAEGNYALVIQSSPPEAGEISPGLGVHEIQIGQTVGLVATPKPGYRFAYWLGDVSSSVVSETAVSIDYPKLVVAVFVRDEFDDGFPGGAAAGIVEGQTTQSSRSFTNTAAITSTRSVSPGLDYNFPSYSYNPQTETDSGSDDIPVPDSGDDIPVPDEIDENTEVPEPATLVLLGMGGFLLRRRRQ